MASKTSPTTCFLIENYHTAHLNYSMYEREALLPRFLRNHFEDLTTKNYYERSDGEKTWSEYDGIRTLSTVRLIFDQIVAKTERKETFSKTYDAQIPALAHARSRHPFTINTAKVLERLLQPMIEEELPEVQLILEKSDKGIQLTATRKKPSP